MGGRVREEMVNSLQETYPENTAYFHLTRGLFAKDIEFNQGGVSDEAGVKMRAGIVGAETEFDVAQEAQQALAHIRTDLDSFTDVEAGCLQADGYQMSEPRLLKMGTYLSSRKIKSNWQFGRYLSVLKTGDERAIKQLKLGSRQFLKPSYYVLRGAASIAKAIQLMLVSLPLLASIAVLLLILDWGIEAYAGVGLWAIITDIDSFVLLVRELAPGIYVLLASFILSKLANLIIHDSGNWMSNLQKVLKGPMAIITGIVIRVLLPAIFAIPIVIYIYTVDRYFIKVMGKLD